MGALDSHPPGGCRRLVTHRWADEYTVLRVNWDYSCDTPGSDGITADFPGSIDPVPEGILQLDLSGRHDFGMGLETGTFGIRAQFRCSQVARFAP